MTRPEIFVPGGWSSNNLATSPLFGPWPVNWRRLFVLTLPISGPLYLAAFIGWMLVTLALMPFVVIGLLIQSLWQR